ncbi:hypothetical protein FRY98_19985 [Paenibacillus faecis]|uniref:Uncharacterized protein n=1 Tax=Paenibacillus faecis TaxID=862114 RepID=A0A5D0CN18_9BACL|nr:hypothetical protein [Paenibacillus faecis]TYA11429.1 hypothetical protein FRY98_19985 [Paenibacillus faecis]
MLPSFQLQKDANLQVFKAIPEGIAKKDANLQVFPAILEKRADLVKNSCRFAGILKCWAPNKKKHAHMQEFILSRLSEGGLLIKRTPSTR